VNGGQIQGDLYLSSGEFGPASFYNQGEFTGTLAGNTTPSSNNFIVLGGDNVISSPFTNSISFAPLSHVHGHGAGLPILLHSSGATRNFLTQLGSLSRSSVGLGQKIGSTIIGGQVSGTLYVNGLEFNPPSQFVAGFNVFTPSPPFPNVAPGFVFSFGKDPLNNPALAPKPPSFTNLASFIQIPNPGPLRFDEYGDAVQFPVNSYILFGNGKYQKMEIISGGQLVGLFKSPYGQQGFGLTFGNVPSNNLVADGVLTNLASFINF